MQKRSLILSSAIILTLILCSQTFAAAGDFILGAASSMVDVFPDSVPELSRSIDISAARGESESAQLVIFAKNAPVRVDRVVISDLTRKDGKSALDRSNIETRLVGYIQIEKSSWRGANRTGLWPDPLLKFRAFECPAGQSRSIWITVSVPRDAKPGDYSGKITLYNDNRQIGSLPINLKIFNFALPEYPTLHTSYWTNLDMGYDLKKEPQILDKTIALFGKYRTSTNLMYGDDAVWYKEADGSITCDFSE